MRIWLRRIEVLLLGGVVTFSVVAACGRAFQLAAEGLRRLHLW